MQGSAGIDAEERNRVSKGRKKDGCGHSIEMVRKSVGVCSLASSEARRVKHCGSCWWS